MSWVLGVHIGHDQSACLLKDGEIVIHIEEERLTRMKHGLPQSVHHLWQEFSGHFGYFPWAAVSYALSAVGIGIDDLDLLVLSDDAQQTALSSIIPMKNRSKILIVDDPECSSHHFFHALSGFYASPFERAAVLVADGDGSTSDEGSEAETGYLFEERGRRFRQIFKNRYKRAVGKPGLRGGLGSIYDDVTALIGFVNSRIVVLTDAGKTMGLAPYGRPNAEFSDPWIKYDGFKLDFSGFYEFLKRSGLGRRINFEHRDRGLISSEEAILQEAKDLAWKVQDEIERAMMHLADGLHKATGASELCLAGGVALNSVANGLILSKGPYSQVFVQPAAGDNGQAIGLAYYGHLQRNERTPLVPVRHAFGGRAYSRDEVRALLEPSGLPFEELPDDAALAQDAAALIVSSQVIGWFQGGSEYGPRALGHRSILADPRQAGMKDHVNNRVKFREPFRPFAPSVLRERAADVFALKGESPYMLIVADVRPAWRDRVPAITHVDHSARIQTVDRDIDPVYHGLISAFDALTGVPLVLNTSYNLRGMPIVETPYDALQCFLYTEMDALYLGRMKVRRPDAALLTPKLAYGWRFIVERKHGETGSELQLRFTSPDGKKSVPVPDFAPIGSREALASFCASLDGRRSFADALSNALGGAQPQEQLSLGLRFLQGLLRAGALRLRIGEAEM